MRVNKRIKRNTKLIVELIKLRFHHIMMFRLGFFGPFFVDSSLFLIQLLVFQAIYSKVDRIGTWGKGEMIIFIGTFSMVNAINMVIFFFGVITIPDKIKNGEIDLYLTKPVSPLLRLTFESANPGSIPLLAFSIVIVMYGIRIGKFKITAAGVLMYLFWIVLMTVLWYELEVIIRSISFYVVSIANISKVEEAVMDLCMKIPGVVFKGVYKLLFYCILPYGIIATFPTLSLTGRNSFQMYVFGIGIVIIFGIITAALWKIGLKRYNSVSS
jgi:ABC-type uncharacterized transport system, permease component